MREATRLGVLLALIAGGLMLACGFSRADSARGWYANAGLGLSWVDQEEHVSPAADLGFRVVGAGGFRFNRIWAIELDTGFIRNTFPIRFGSGYTAQEDLPGGKESLSQIPVVVGVLVHLANDSGFEPYGGAGIGVIAVLGEGDRVGGDLSLSFKAGVRRAVNERMAVGVDYTYFMLGFASAFIGEAVGDDTVNLGIHWKL